MLCTCSAIKRSSGRVYRLRLTYVVSGITSTVAKKSSAREGGRVPVNDIAIQQYVIRYFENTYTLSDNIYELGIKALVG